MKHDCLTRPSLTRRTAALRSKLRSLPVVLRGTTRDARLFRISLFAGLVVLVVAMEPAAAQSNPVCSEESGTLENMIEGFIQITTALGLMGLLVVWQADELAGMFTVDQQQAMALKQHKRGAMKSAAILVLLGPLFTIAGSAMNLPIAQCVDLTPF